MFNYIKIIYKIHLRIHQMCNVTLSIPQFHQSTQTIGGSVFT